MVFIILTNEYGAYADQLEQMHALGARLTGLRSALGQLSNLGRTDLV